MSRASPPSCRRCAAPPSHPCPLPLLTTTPASRPPRPAGWRGLPAGRQRCTWPPSALASACGGRQRSMLRQLRRTNAKRLQRSRRWPQRLSWRRRRRPAARARTAAPAPRVRLPLRCAASGASRPPKHKLFHAAPARWSFPRENQTCCRVVTRLHLLPSLCLLSLPAHHLGARRHLFSSIFLLFKGYPSAISNPALSSLRLPLYWAAPPACKSERRFLAQL